MLDGGQRAVVGASDVHEQHRRRETGTIQLKATFPNTDNALWPGQFVDVVLTLTSEQAVRGADPGRPGRPAGPLRLRREARSHRGVAAGQGRAGAWPASS